MWTLDQWKDGPWGEFANGTRIGHCRLTRGAKVTTSKVCLRIQLFRENLPKSYRNISWDVGLGKEAEIEVVVVKTLPSGKVLFTR